MALHEIFFEFQNERPQGIVREWSIAGTAGSGDLEVLMEKKALNGGGGCKNHNPL